MMGWNKKIHLKPCPYCGGLAYIEIFQTGTPYISAHHKQDCAMKPSTWLLAAEPLKKQIKEWNKRANDGKENN